MIFYKLKRSFFIIEILLGVFLLGIFIASSQNIPKLTIKPLVEMAVGIKAKHRADRAYFNFIQSDLSRFLNLKPSHSMTFDPTFYPFKIEPFYRAQIEETVTVTLEELKEQKEGQKIGLYKIEINLKILSKIGFKKSFIYYTTIRLN